MIFFIASSFGHAEGHAVKEEEFFINLNHLKADCCFQSIFPEKDCSFLKTFYMCS